ARVSACRQTIPRGMTSIAGVQGGFRKTLLATLRRATFPDAGIVSYPNFASVGTFGHHRSAPKSSQTKIPTLPARKMSTFRYLTGRDISRTIVTQQIHRL